MRLSVHVLQPDCVLLRFMHAMMHAAANLPPSQRASHLSPGMCFLVFIAQCGRNGCTASSGNASPSEYMRAL